MKILTVILLFFSMNVFAAQTDQANTTFCDDNIDLTKADASTKNESTTGNTSTSGAIGETVINEEPKASN